MAILIPIAVYGQTGIGKTYDVCYALRKHHPLVILSEPDGLASVRTHCGWSPDHIELGDLVKPFVEFQRVLLQVKTMATDDKIGSVIFDTGSEFARRVFDAANRSCGGDGRKIYPETARQFGEVIRGLITVVPKRQLFFVVCIFHEAQPKFSDGVLVYQGGPKVQWPPVWEEVRHLFSVVLRAKLTQNEDGVETRQYLCDLGNEQWIAKDRYASTCKEQPMDLRPILTRIIYQEAGKIDKLTSEVLKFDPKPIRTAVI